MTNPVQWALAAIVGAASVFLVRDFIIPLAVGLLTPGVPTIRGRWTSSNVVFGHAGGAHATTETIIVRQIGVFIWGWTEFGVSGASEAIGPGNKFRGRLHGNLFRVTFRARDRRVGFLGSMQGHVYDGQKRAKALYLSRLEEGKMIVWESVMTKNQ